MRGKETKDVGSSVDKQWKMSEMETKVQVGTGVEGERVMAGDGKYG